MSIQEFRIGHLDHLSSPWGNAGGVVRKLEEVEDMAKTLVGWVEVGSLTLEPRVGNEPDPDGGPVRKVYDHNPKSGITANSLGMPNVGVDVWEKQIPEMRQIAEKEGKALIINVAPTSEDPVNEVLELVTRAYEAGAPAVLVNLGCPNVLGEDGQPHEILCYNPQTMFEVLRALQNLPAKYPNVFVRTSPYSNQAEADLAYSNIRAARTVSAVWTPNTWPIKNREVSPLGVRGGGWSGPAMAEKALHQANMARKALAGSSIDVVLSSGVGNFREREAAWTIKQAMDLGAIAAAGTTFYTQIPRDEWPDATYYLLDKLFYRYL